jgi:serine/threonine protein kinase
MNEHDFIERNWNGSEIRACQESIDAAADAEDGATSIFESFLSLVSQLSKVDEGKLVDRKHEVSTWAASLKGATLGRFVIDDWLGHGGFGVVFRAFDPELKRYVAIKIPRPDVLARNDARSRFLEEARVVAILRHPGIVQVHDTGSVGPLVYIASELCSGETLRDWISARPDRIDQKLAARIVMDLADTVGYAHSRGVIHQDLKPGNVLIDRPVTPDESGMPWPLRITDFGLACRLSAQGGVSESLAGGTRRYMAPEQLAGDASQIGTHTDVYALGVMLGELLWDKVNTTRNCLSPSRESDLLSNQFRPPKSVPPDLCAVYLRCVEDDPVNRYRDGWSLRDDLRNYIDKRPVRARPLTPSRLVKSWCSRWPVAALLVGLLLLAIGIGVTGTVVGIRRTHQSLYDLSVAYGALSRRSGNWQNALGYLKTAIEGQPNQAVYLDYADTLISLQRYEEANWILSLAKDRSAPEYKGRQLLLEGELALARNRPWDEVEPIFRGALASSQPESSDAHLAAAMCAASTPEAVRLLRSAVEVDPYHHLAHVKLLAGLFFLGQYDEAEAECAAIQLLFPEDWTPNAYSAFISLGRGDRQRADAYIDEVRAKFSHDELVGFEQELTAFQSLTDLASKEEEWTVAQRLLDTVKSAAAGFRSEDASAPVDLVSVGFRRPVLPTVSRAWQHVQIAVMHLKHETLPTACQELTRAIKLHPEATLFQIHAAACIELNYANPQELLAKTEAATASYQAATEHPSMFPGMQPAARRLAVMGQYILGRPTRRVGAPDPEMRRLALVNIRTLLSANETLGPRYLEMFANYAAELSDFVLAREVAIRWHALAPNDQRSVLFLAKQDSSLGEHEEALKRLRSVSWQIEYAHEASSLADSCEQALARLISPTDAD